MKYMKVSPNEKKNSSHRLKKKRKKKDFHLTCTKKNLPSLKMTYRIVGSYEKRFLGEGGGGGGGG